MELLTCSQECFGANLSTFIFQAVGVAPLVIAHQVNKRAAATLNRFC